MIKTAIVTMALCVAFTGLASAKPKTGKRSNYTKEQQAKYYVEAMKICRKKYGPEAIVYKMDYVRLRVVCQAR
jgi:hypothetical protein